MKLVHVSFRSCTLHDDGCISSTNYPNPFPLVDNCWIKVREGNDWVIHVKDFNALGQFLINDIEYLNKGPSGVVPRGTIMWRSAA